MDFETSGIWLFQAIRWLSCVFIEINVAE